MKDISILLVVGDRDLRQTMSACLVQFGARVDPIASLSEARRRVPRAAPHLVVFDADDRSEDVLSFVSELDSLGIDAIVLATYADIGSRIDYFERGVLDVIPKPVDARELVLRVARFYKPKRGAALPLQVEIACGAAMLDITHRTLRNGRKPQVPLTGSEFRLLYLLVQNEKRVVERNEIARAALGQGNESASRSIDVMISKLRRKLEDIGSQRFIRSVRSEGYMLIGDERTTSRHGHATVSAPETAGLVGTT